MAKNMALVVFLGVWLQAMAEARHCPTGQFLAHTSRECQICSDCPADQIVREPCLPHKDTVCGPFYEFQQFNVGDKGKLQKANLEANQNDNRDQNDTKEAHWNFENSSDFEAMLRSYFMKDPFKFNSPSKDEVEGSPNSPTNVHTEVPLPRSAETTWRELCFGLMGALLSVTFLSALYIVLAYVRARRRASGHKLITIVDPEDPTVLYHTPVSPEEHLPQGTKPSHTLRHLEGQLASNKGRNLLQSFLKMPEGNEYVTEIFEVRPGVHSQTHNSTRSFHQGGTLHWSNSELSGDAISLNIPIPAPDEDDGDLGLSDQPLMAPGLSTNDTELRNS